MTLDPKPKRLRPAVGRWLALALPAILILAPAAADASVARITSADRLEIIDDQGSDDNAVKLSYDPDTPAFVVADSAGITPGPGCLPAGVDQVACADPLGSVRRVDASLRGGDDVLEVSVEPGTLLPSSLTETVADGGGGNDSLVGGGGRERLLGQGGRDVLAGGGGADEVLGGGARDALIGYGGDDLLLGGNGSDAGFGFGGDDMINGQGGSDTLLGGRGTDQLLGGAKHDLLRGGREADYLFGQAGPDQLLAKDRTRDRRINCGAGKPEKLSADKRDPRGISC